MDKLLFYARNDIKNSKSSVGKKVLRQYKVFSGVFDTFLLAQSGNTILLKHNDIIKEEFCKFRKSVLYFYNKKVIELIKQYKIRFVYIRYPKTNPLFLFTLRRMKKLGCKIILELPTYPYDNEIITYGKGFFGHIIFYSDWLFRTFLKKYIYKVFTYSNDEIIWGIPSQKIINGILFDEIKQIRKSNERNDETINLIAVAEMQLAHGYDRLIEGLRLYYANEQIVHKKIILHLVGDGVECRHYKQIVQKYDLNNNVVFHGYCVGNKLSAIYDICDAAIELLGGHRNNLTVSSSLKSREYLAKGLPIITSINIDIIPNDADFLIKVPGDESPIDISQLLLSLEEIKAKKITSDDIRKFAMQNCDLNNTLLPVINAFYEE